LELYSLVDEYGRFQVESHSESLVLWATEETYSTVSRLVFEIPNLKFFLI